MKDTVATYTRHRELAIRTIEAIPVAVPLLHPINGRAAKSGPSTTSSSW